MKGPIVTGLISLLLALAGFVSAQAVDPAASFEPELLAKGEAVFLEVGGMGCAACHGRFAANELNIAPVIRGVDSVRIHGALQAMQAMLFLQPLISDDEVDAVAYYLGYLNTMVPAVVSVRQATFEPSAVTVPSGSLVQLILSNQDRSVCTWTLSEPDTETATIKGRATGAVVWQAPEEIVSVEAYCAETPDVRLAVETE